jgi:transposase
MNGVTKKLRQKLSGILFLLNEKQRRLLVGAEAQALGYGGIKILSDATGIDCKTIRRGVQELKQRKQIKDQLGRVRAEGGGRKKITDQEPEIIRIIEDLIEPDTRGDPESPLRWTCKSVRNIEDFLQEQGYDISYKTVSSILHDLEYSLQGNRKTKEGKDHPDRDAQFKYINKIVKRFLKVQDPVISVDTKKKELIGNYKNPGKEWAAKGTPKEVNGHDFPDPKVPKAVPYGVYDIGNNSGWVNVGMSADTAEFAVESIQYWWKKIGERRYPKSTKLLICADAGLSITHKYQGLKWADKKNPRIKSLSLIIPLQTVIIPGALSLFLPMCPPSFAKA